MKLKLIIVSKDDKFAMTGEDFSKYSNNVCDIDISFVSNNTEPLANIYNKYLNISRNNFDVFGFLHADVSFDITEVIAKLNKIKDKYDVIGFCGTEVVNVSQCPLNWFTASIPTPEKRWGCVSHGELGDATSFFSIHHPDITDHEVACIDGLGIFFTKKALSEPKFLFDETFKYDFYDTDISFQALVNFKFKLGVIITKSLKHFSIGKSIMEEDFLGHELDFRKKWKLDIPPNPKMLEYMAKNELRNH